MADDVRLEIVAVDKTRAAVDSAKRNMQGLEQAAKNANNTFAQVGRTAAGVFGGMAAFAAASGVSRALVGIGQTAFDAYAKAERLRQSLQAMSAKEIMQAGGANNMAQALQLAGTRAKELQGWIERMAVQSPFNQEDVASALRMGMAYGFNSREAQRLTQIMLDYSAATGQSGETMQRVALALGQIRARGKLAGQEINQLTEAGINVRQILADAFGKTTAEITAMSEKGLIGANEAIQAITNSLETDFKGAAAASATSMAGLVATFEDIAQLRLRDLFAGVFESAQPYITDIADVLSGPKFTLAITTLGAALGGFTTDKLSSAAGYIQQISDAIDKVPTETPGWMVALSAVNVSQFDSVLGTLKTIESTMAALGEGDYETAWTIVAGEQDPEVKEWMTWFGSQASHTATATATFVGEAGANFNEWWAWFTDEAERTTEAVVNFTATTTESSSEWFTWLQDETNREITVAAKMADDAGTSLTKWWEDWKVENEKANATWQPTITAVANWADGIWETLTAEAQTGVGEPIDLDAEWASTTLSTLWVEANKLFVGSPFSFMGEWASSVLQGTWDALQAQFTTPVMILGDWFGGVAESLWAEIQRFFSAKPVQVNAQTTSYTEGSRPYGMPANFQAPVDVTMPPPQSNYFDFTNNAVGDGFFQGGLALVGEVGPELVSMPRGTKIMRSHDTRKVLGKIPAFAEGNTPLGGALDSLVDSVLNMMGVKYRPPTESHGLYGVEGAKAVNKAWTEAAANTENAFTEAAEKSAEASSKAIESMLQGVPGLFGTSGVTADQMRQAEAGVPQNFADNYLRRLSDEVLNGVDWAGVDIGDAAARAGIDPNLPANMILELFRSAWEDSSLFSNPENLDLIDTGAVQDFIAKQQAAALGKANVLAFFGDPDVANNALGSMASAIGSAATNEDNAAALRDAGYAGAAVYYSGWTSYMNGAPIVPPGTAPTATGVPVPPGKAVGVGYWPGGAMRVHRDETIYLPHGAGVATAAESRRMGGGGDGAVTINAQVSSNIDVEALTSQVARRLRARMN